MSDIIYLYLKTHNKTGLKYLGKTVRDPYLYNGSGVYWSKHLEKHGNDIHTDILFETTCKEEFKKVATEISEKLNIIESAEFANMTIEQGQGGITQTGEEHHLFGKPWGRGVKGSNAGKENPNYGKRGKEASFHGKTHSEETKEQISKKAKIKFECSGCGRMMNKGNLAKHSKKCKRIRWAE